MKRFENMNLIELSKAEQELRANNSENPLIIEFIKSSLIKVQELQKRLSKKDAG